MLAAARHMPTHGAEIQEMRVKPIVVGIDGSETSTAALERAAEIATALQVELHIVAVVTDTVAQADEGESVLAIDHADEIVAAAAAAYVHLTVVKAAIPGVKAGEALVRYAEKHRAQIIVIGNRGMTGLRRLLGSVPNDVTHNAPCDVLIVKTT